MDLSAEDRYLGHRPPPHGVEHIWWKGRAPDVLCADFAPIAPQPRRDFQRPAEMRSQSILNENGSGSRIGTGSDPGIAVVQNCFLIPVIQVCARWVS
jgi:hypothetical protein